MNEDSYNEFRFFLNTVAKEIGDNEKNKILSISSKLINSENYMNIIKEELNKIIETENFNLITDFSILIKTVLDCNKHVDFYKEITVDRLKYLMYPVLYAHLYKNNTDLLNSINISDFRILYINAMDLLLIPVQSIKIDKVNCLNCIGRTFKFLSWLESKKKI